jgi:sterol desaturase/sphingolipid hydroxylase (fatty acid hydroxylase superfamily)
VHFSNISHYLVAKFEALFLTAGSTFSLASLFCAFCVAVTFLVVRRLRRSRRIRLKALARALFPRSMRRSPSLRTDIGYVLLGTLVFGVILGWALLSYQVLNKGVIAGLTQVFGPREPTALPEVAVRASITLALFLAYEFAYWVDHYISHRAPFFWEFHKVHHDATVLTPLTVFRIHPVDGLLHGNITAVILAAVGGAATYLFGKTAHQYAITDTNLLLVLAVYAYVHLQHSHLWIAFRGTLGRILLSPAHHQVHHSTNPAHFNKNLGSTLAIWDWLFGTLHIPAKQRERLRFGVEDAPGHERLPADVHSVPASIVRPFGAALAHLAPAFGRPKADRPPVSETGAAVTPTAMPDAAAGA